MAEAPSRTVRRTASQLRRAAAEEAERAFSSALYSKDVGSGKLRTPPRLERRAERFGGGFRSRGGEYDWFYSLHPAEQARIRQNWMSSAGGVGSATGGGGRAMTPDEMEAAGLPVGEWLALTRGIDAARAVRTGRQLQPKRYGGRDPSATVLAGVPEEEGTWVRVFRSRRPEDPDHEIPDGDEVQFFTDENGVVHPIRASYENRPGIRTRRLTRAQVFERYGTDEAF